MTVFKYFWKILLSQKVGILIYFGIMVGLTFVFSDTSGNNQLDFVSVSRDIVIFDEDESALSVGLVDFLSEYHQLVEIENSVQAIEDALFFQEVSYVLTIPAGFEHDFLIDPSQGRLENIKDPESINGFYIDGQIESFLITLATYINADFTPEYALRNTMVDLNNHITVEMLADYPPNNALYFFRFAAFTILAIIATAIAPIFFVMNKKEIARRNESASMSLIKQNGQLALGCVLGSVTLWSMLIAVPFLLFGDEMLTTVNALRVVNSFALLVVAVGIAFLLGNVITNYYGLTGAISVVGMFLGFLSGVFIPLEAFSENMRAFARFLPTYWYVSINDMLGHANVVDRNMMGDFWQGILIQLGFGIAIFAVTLMIIRQKKMHALI
ncbi:MAG: ABC transporter permease [Lachnospiraceae bacterium]|nr:ABC transporter permease [Lachnospiraceae bacterium]